MKYLSFILAFLIFSCKSEVEVKETSYNIFEVTYDTDKITSKDYLRSYCHTLLRNYDKDYELRDSVIISFINRCEISGDSIITPNKTSSKSFNLLVDKINLTPKFIRGKNDLHLMSKDTTLIKDVEITHYGDRKLLIRVSVQLPEPIEKVHKYSIDSDALDSIGTFKSALFCIVYHYVSNQGKITGIYDLPEFSILRRTYSIMNSRYMKLLHISDCKKLSKHLIEFRDQDLLPEKSYLTIHVSDDELFFYLSDLLDQPIIIGSCPLRSTNSKFNFIIYHNI